MYSYAPLNHVAGHAGQHNALCSLCAKSSKLKALVSKKVSKQVSIYLLMKKVQVTKLK